MLALHSLCRDGDIAEVHSTDFHLYLTKWLEISMIHLVVRQNP